MTDFKVKIKYLCNLEEFHEECNDNWNECCPNANDHIG